MTLSDVVAQRTLTECAAGSTELDNTLTTDHALIDMIMRYAQGGHTDERPHPYPNQSPNRSYGR
ncbi:hypothetical protein GCM10009000_085500 [Halobacterium noricense]|uniref:Uncharacterized protein n=1 Tax=Haladaptatus pallidirubidus TaxID=1008152 RepID=A0AAV3URD6_9EURY